MINILKKKQGIYTEKVEQEKERRVFVLPTHNFPPICTPYPISLQIFSPITIIFPQFNGISLFSVY